MLALPCDAAGVVAGCWRWRLLSWRVVGVRCNRCLLVLVAVLARCWLLLRFGVVVGVIVGVVVGLLLLLLFVFVAVFVVVVCCQLVAVVAALVVVAVYCWCCCCG